MFRDIIGTIGARYVVAFLNLLLIFINSKVLGRDGMGFVGIIYASAGIAVIFNSIFCGNTIVYFMNRYNLRYVFYPAYIWAFVGSVIACVVMYFLNMLPEGYEAVTFGLAVLMSLVAANSLMLLGKDKVISFNLVYLVQGGLTFGLLLCIYYIGDYKTVEGCLAGIFATCLVVFFFSFILLFPSLLKKESVPEGTSFFVVLKEMLVYGIWIGADNLAEGLTTRLNYFFVRNIGGYGNVGLLDAGTKMSESVWHISNSVSYIEYKSVSKTTDRQEQKCITLKLFKLTYCALITVMAVIVCIPEWVFTEYLLTSEFAGISDVIIGMSIGIVAFGSNRIISHYFVGSGNVRYSTFCSFFGLAVLLVTGLILIPEYGVLGAAITSSIAYTCMLVFSIVAFIKQTGAAPREFLLSKDDVKTLKDKIKKKLTINN